VVIIFINIKTKSERKMLQNHVLHPYHEKEKKTKGHNSEKRKTVI
jgi:hypothetical protein